MRKVSFVQRLCTTSTIALTAWAVLSQQPAHAADAPPTDGPADIVVTAQHREQNLQDVGIAISAFSGDTLRKMGVQSSTDLARLTPGVSISASQGGQNSQFSIRGVTQNDFSDAIEAPVALYIDETYVPNMNGQVFGSFDLQRAEVLKGPQGTLFGRNATGGLVHFVPVKPSEKLSAYADVTYGSYDHVRVESAVGGALAPNVQFRISGLYNSFGPILKNIYPYGVSSLSAGKTPPGPQCCSDLWNDDTKAIRGQLQFEPTDRLTIRLTGSYSSQIMGENPYNSVATIGVYDAQGRLVNAQFAGANETRIAIGPNGANYGTNGQPTTATRPVAGGDFFGYIAPSARSLKISTDWALPDMNKLHAWDVAAHINYAFDNAELVSITNYRDFRKTFGTDVDSGPENLIDFISDSHQHSLSQELRLSGTGKKPLRWVTGLYVLDVNSLVHNGFQAPSNSIFAASFGAPFATQGIDLINDVNLKTVSISGFGQVEYDVTPKLTAIAGGRVIHEHQNYSFDSWAHANANDYAFDYGPRLFQLQEPYSNSRNTMLWAGKAQLEYRPNRDVLAYFGVNRGVKGGAYNAALPDGSPSLSPSQIPYKPETLLSYEGGVKTTWLDGKMTVDLSAYYYDYHNYQAFTFANVSGIVTNNNARTYGIEASVNLRPVHGLNIGLGMSLLDAKVFNLAIASGVIRDVRPTFTPTKTFAAQIAYTVPQPVLGGTLDLNIDASWRSNVYANLRNFDADIINPYLLANMHAYWSIDHLRFGVGVDNLFDQRYKTTTYNLATLCGCNEEAYGAPRWVNVSVRYTY